MKYSEALNFIDSSFVSFQTAGKSAYREGLDTIARMMTHLGNPERNFHVIHVAGTNGKGSVSHILASVLQAAGYRTGLFTSPHLHEFRERMRIDGELVPESQVADFVERNGTKMTELGISYFEMTVAMAFDWFSADDVEVAVVETGLGGRLDATNIVVPELSVITNIGLEHTSILGSTLAAIAFEKGGIIKPNVPVVIGERNPSTDNVFERIAEERGSKIIFAEELYRIVDSDCGNDRCTYTVERLRDARTQELSLDLMGAYQAKNLITVRGAVHAIRHLTCIDISSRALVEGCRNAAASTGLTGRWQVIGHSPLTICDTGHNAHGLKYVTTQLREQFGNTGDRKSGCYCEKLSGDTGNEHITLAPDNRSGSNSGDRDNGRQGTDDSRQGKLFIILGVSDDKDLASILPLFPSQARYIFTQASSPRALPAAELARRASRYGLTGEVVPDVGKALARARELASPEDTIFIGGSSFVVAEVV